MHTFVTNLRGPAEPLTLAGAPVRAVIPVPSTTDNVTVTFGVLSQAGTLRITILSDPGRVPDVAVLAGALRRELAAATSPVRTYGLSAPVVEIWSGGNVALAGKPVGLVPEVVAHAAEVMNHDHARPRTWASGSCQIAGHLTVGSAE